MNYRQFAKKWIEKSGLSDPDSDYNGELGRAVMELVEVFSKQGHSGMSAQLTTYAFDKLNRDYNDPKNELWKEYWKSPEGKKLMEEHS